MLRSVECLHTSWESNNFKLTVAIFELQRKSVIPSSVVPLSFVGTGLIQKSDNFKVPVLICYVSSNAWPSCAEILWMKPCKVVHPQAWHPDNVHLKSYPTDPTQESHLKSTPIQRSTFVASSFEGNSLHLRNLSPSIFSRSFRSVSCQPPRWQEKAVECFSKMGPKNPVRSRVK